MPVVSIKRRQPVVVDHAAGPRVSHRLNASINRFVNSQSSATPMSASSA